MKNTLQVDAVILRPPILFSDENFEFRRNKGKSPRKKSVFEAYLQDHVEFSMLSLAEEDRGKNQSFVCLLTLVFKTAMFNARTLAAQARKTNFLRERY